MRTNMPFEVIIEKENGSASMRPIICTVRIVRGPKLLVDKAVDAITGEGIDYDEIGDLRSVLSAVQTYEQTASLLAEVS